MIFRNFLKGGPNNRNAKKSLKIHFPNNILKSWAHSILSQCEIQWCKNRITVGFSLERKFLHQARPTVMRFLHHFPWTKDSNGPTSEKTINQFRFIVIGLLIKNFFDPIFLKIRILLYRNFWTYPIRSEIFQLSDIRIRSDPNFFALSDPKSESDVFDCRRHPCYA